MIVEIVISISVLSVGNYFMGVCWVVSSVIVLFWWSRSVVWILCFRLIVFMSLNVGC